VSNQVRYSVIDRTIEDGLLQYCQRRGITVIAYSPLGRDFERVRDCDPAGVLTRLATETGRTPAQIALNWCVAKEGVVAIPKSNSLAHMLENCGASGWRLTAEQTRALDTAIQYGRRNRLDRLVRRYTPGPARVFALKAVRHLPRGLRRRLV
jgi:diketogulonate reductase-like aldo/keto reductase